MMDGTRALRYRDLAILFIAALLFFLLLERYSFYSFVTLFLTLMYFVLRKKKNTDGSPVTKNASKTARNVYTVLLMPGLPMGFFSTFAYFGPNASDNPLTDLFVIGCMLYPVSVIVMWLLYAALKNVANERTIKYLSHLPLIPIVIVGIAIALLIIKCDGTFTCY